MLTRWPQRTSGIRKSRGSVSARSTRRSGESPLARSPRVSESAAVAIDQDGRGENLAAGNKLKHTAWDVYRSVFPALRR
jgi:hypothetical protein